jgi:hypothetical protein
MENILAGPSADCGNAIEFFDAAEGGRAYPWNSSPILSVLRGAYCRSFLPVKYLSIIGWVV